MMSSQRYSSLLRDVVCFRQYAGLRAHGNADSQTDELRQWTVFHRAIEPEVGWIRQGQGGEQEISVKMKCS